MANLTLTSTWEANVYELATTDPVQGGPGGIANEQAQKLGNRTEWLKTKVDQLLAGDFQFKDAVALTSNTTLALAHMGAFIRLTGSGNPTITLPAYNSSDALKDGQAIVIKNDTTNINAATIATSDSGVVLADGEFGQSATGISLRPRDTVIIIYRANQSNPTTAVGTYHALVIKGDSTPVGTIIMHGANTAPDGYIECDGSALSRTTYKRLFDTIGTSFGAGNGTTTFNIPDFRGYFPRGWNNAASVDSGRVFGSTQQDELKSHFHLMKKNNFNSGSGAGLFGMDDHGVDGSENTESTGGSETRPKNVAVLFVIKY